MLNSKEALEHICKNCDNECCPYIHYEQSRCAFYGVIRKDLDRLEMLEEILDILRNNTYICKNGDGFTISIWLNTENCDMPSCSNLDELLKVLKVLKEKKVMRDTYSKEVLENDK